MGNTIVVSFLLSRGANPNIGGPNLSTPLIRAIDIAQSGVKIYLVNELLLHGADARLRDGSGRTAFDAAKDAGLASGEIKRLLSQSTSRRPSDAETVNTTNTSSTNASSAYSYLTYNGIDLPSLNRNPRPGGKGLFNWFLHRSGQ
jgi:ankyrin repeat protein